jgi:hypothetical protein
MISRESLAYFDPTGDFETVMTRLICIAYLAAYRAQKYQQAILVCSNRLKHTKMFIFLSLPRLRRSQDR